MPDHSVDNQQSGYSQCESAESQNSNRENKNKKKQTGNTLTFNSTVGGWFLPGQSPICPSSSPPQFSGTAGHSSGSYCERYSSLRSHRASPYPGHYPHRASSTSKTLGASPPLWFEIQGG